MGLERFIKAQERDYETAMSEIRAGKKRGHWMWYIFPQVAGLGMSDMSKHYAIKDLREATDYLLAETLGVRLTNICKVLLELQTADPYEIFGSPDHLKLKSSMTLFDAVPATFPVFGQVLDKFYQREHDPQTLRLLGIKQ
jgi:uncharacterized protein (DUF1810 family)